MVNLKMKLKNRMISQVRVCMFYIQYIHCGSGPGAEKLCQSFSVVIADFNIHIHMHIKHTR